MILEIIKGLLGFEFLEVGLVIEEDEREEMCEKEIRKKDDGEKKKNSEIREKP